nr:GNAT family N-acetyltransferase [Frigoribacterium sp. VKM Ac-2836]
MHLERVAFDDPRAVALRDAMDAEMTVRYHRDVVEPVAVVEARNAALTVHPSNVLATVLVVADDGVDGGTAVGHALVQSRDGEWEVKRVIVADGQRGRGIGRLLMAELETIAREGGARRLILQTGDRQPDAVALYEKIGFTRIPTYEPYVTTIPQSICFEKPVV